MKNTAMALGLVTGLFGIITYVRFATGGGFVMAVTDERLSEMQKLLEAMGCRNKLSTDDLGIYLGRWPSSTWHG
jgi:hypothetical protein